MILPRMALWLIAGGLAAAPGPAAPGPPADRPGTGAERTQTGPPGSAAPRATIPAPFRVDLQASRVYIKVGTGGYGHVHGVQGRLSAGKIALGGPGDLVFDVTSFTADEPGARQYLGLNRSVSRSDQQKTTETMRGPQVLDVARFPKAAFRIAACTPVEGQAAGAPGRYRLDGEFLLHGVKRPLRIEASVEMGDRQDLRRLRGSFSIMQSQFGMTPYSALAGLVRVSDQLEVWGDLVLQASVP